MTGTDEFGHELDAQGYERATGPADGVRPDPRAAAAGQPPRPRGPQPVGQPMPGQPPQDAPWTADAASSAGGPGYAESAFGGQQLRPPVPAMPGAARQTPPMPGHDAPTAEFFPLYDAGEPEDYQVPPAAAPPLPPSFLRLPNQPGAAQQQPDGQPGSIPQQAPGQPGPAPMPQGTAIPQQMAPMQQQMGAVPPPAAAGPQSGPHFPHPQQSHQSHQAQQPHQQAAQVQQLQQDSDTAGYPEQQEHDPLAGSASWSAAPPRVGSPIPQARPAQPQRPAVPAQPMPTPTPLPERGAARPTARPVGGAAAAGAVAAGRAAVRQQAAAQTETDPLASSGQRRAAAAAQVQMPQAAGPNVHQDPQFGATNGQQASSQVGVSDLHQSQQFGVSNAQLGEHVAAPNSGQGQQAGVPGAEQGQQGNVSGAQSGQQAGVLGAPTGQQLGASGIQHGQQGNVPGALSDQLAGALGAQAGQQVGAPGVRQGQQGNVQGVQPGQEAGVSGTQLGQQGQQAGQRPGGLGAQAGQQVGASGIQHGQQGNVSGAQSGRQTGASGVQAAGQQGQQAGVSAGQQGGASGVQHGQQAGSTGVQQGNQSSGGVSGAQQMPQPGPSAFEPANPGSAATSASTSASASYQDRQGQPHSSPDLESSDTISVRETMAPPRRRVSSAQPSRQQSVAGDDLSSERLRSVAPSVPAPRRVPEDSAPDLPLPPRATQPAQPGPSQPAPAESPQSAQLAERGQETDELVVPWQSVAQPAAEDFGTAQAAPRGTRRRAESSVDDVVPEPLSAPQPVLLDPEPGDEEDFAPLANSGVYEIESDDEGGADDPLSGSGSHARPQASEQRAVQQGKEGPQAVGAREGQASPVRESAGEAVNPAIRRPGAQAAQQQATKDSAAAEQQAGQQPQSAQQLEASLQGQAQVDQQLQSAQPLQTSSQGHVQVDEHSQSAQQSQAGSPGEAPAGQQSQSVQQLRTSQQVQAQPGQESRSAQQAPQLVQQPQAAEQVQPQSVQQDQGQSGQQSLAAQQDQAQAGQQSRSAQQTQDVRQPQEGVQQVQAQVDQQSQAVQSQSGQRSRAAQPPQSGQQAAQQGQTSPVQQEALSQPESGGGQAQPVTPSATPPATTGRRTAAKQPAKAASSAATSRTSRTRSQAADPQSGSVPAAAAASAATATATAAAPAASATAAPTGRTSATTPTSAAPATAASPSPAAAAPAAAAPTTTPTPTPTTLPDGTRAPGYGEEALEAVYRVIHERRDIRNDFLSDELPTDVLTRILEAAHTAPSVGYSQPWDFLVLRDEERRRAVHDLAVRQRRAYAASLPKARAKAFAALKIEAILDTPVNIVVTCDPTRGGRHTLGRYTQPMMAPFSTCLAVENLWLAARAEGLGVGWVSFFDERELAEALGLPEHLQIVAYLCVGYVKRFPAEPELAGAGWAKRRPLSWAVHEEDYGRRAMPGGSPVSLLDATVDAVRGLDVDAVAAARERQGRMTKPPGSLGMLEHVAEQLAGLSGQCPPPLPEPAALAVFAADHGVHAQGVTPWPQEVTAQMVANFLAGGAVVNAFAKQVGAEVCVVDVGVNANLGNAAGLIPRKVRFGTADMTQGPAMSRDEAMAAIEAGIETARDLVAAGNRCLLTGDMGIANTTASAALIAAFTGASPAQVTGYGTGIDEQTYAHKVEIVRRALELHRPDPQDPIGVLAAFGGLEHAALAGFILGGAALRIPVLLDGVIAGAAALVAQAIAPEVTVACVAGHRSAEPGHALALEALGVSPLIDLELRLGEGSGAVLALPLVASAVRALREVATFDSAGVADASSAAVAPTGRGQGA